MLSAGAIRKALDKGEIIIDPYDPKCLKGSSVDVRLGPYYYKRRTVQDNSEYYNPYDKESVERRWGKPLRARKAKDVFKRPGSPLHIMFPRYPRGIMPDDEVIVIAPGSTILCHTLEFIGSNHASITCNMSARSSTRRNNITVCDCAGKGDPKYFNRWTMEMKNQDQSEWVIVVVGRRYAQIDFHKMITDEADENQEWAKEALAYNQGGKYQDTGDLQTLKDSWCPEMMLPKKYQDREAIVFNKEQQKEAWMEVFKSQNIWVIIFLTLSLWFADCVVYFLMDEGPEKSITMALVTLFASVFWTVVICLK